MPPILVRREKSCIFSGCESRPATVVLVVRGFIPLVFRGDEVFRAYIAPKQRLIADVELVAAVLFAVAKMQRDELSNATKRGLAAAKERGVKLGKRPGKWTAQVKALHDSGLSVIEIANRLGRSRQGVRNVLKGKTATYAS